jgi:hypothetical protein
VKLDLTKMLGANGKHGADASQTKKGKSVAGAAFEAALGDAKQTPARRSSEHKAELSPERPSKDEKKTRPGTGTEEALLVSRTLTAHSRITPLIGTKPSELKPVAKDVKVDSAKVTLDQLAARSKGHAEHQRVTEPTEHSKKPAPVHKKEDGELKDSKKEDETKVASLAAPTGLQNQAPEVFRIEAPPAIKEAAPLAQVMPMMMDDASVRAVLLPTVARVSMDVENAGRLNLQLKVNDGVTDIRAAGPAAHLLESRQGEIRVALAKEGLALGHFDLTQSGSQQQQHTERGEFDFATPTARRAAASSNDITVEDGRVHVKV